MKALIISDLHLTDNPNEDYRWNIFDWTKTTLENEHCTRLFILGDIFDKKDRHPAKIVNRLAKVLMEISSQYPTYILQGNHDYLLREHPFLSFLDHLPNITWISVPSQLTIDNFNMLWLPHSRNPMEEWKDQFDKKFDYVFMHQSVIGCKVSNYFEMNCGLDLAWLESQVKCPIVSGDIHVPQTIRSLTYVGTQHPVAFGDDYDCRALLLTTTTNKDVKVKTWELESLPVMTIKRHSIVISNLDDLNQMYKDKVLREHDQAKIKIMLMSDQLSQWSTLKELVTTWCETHNITLYDIKLEKVDLGNLDSVKSRQSTFIPVQPTETFQRFLLQEELDKKIIVMGQTILNEVIK